MLVLAVAGIGLALARPQWGEQAENEPSAGAGRRVRAGLLAQHAGHGCGARAGLQRAKLAILEFVQRHGHGRIGLVAFAGQAFLQCPLTFDYGAFQDALAAIDDKTIPVPGTDVGRALDEGFHAMEKGERQKVMVLLTDGEDLEKGGVTTAEKLGQAGRGSIRHRRGHARRRRDPDA